MKIRTAMLGLALLLWCLSPVHADIANYTRQMNAHEGFIPLYFDAAAGKVYLQIDATDAPVLYTVMLAGGMGANAVRLDRGSPGGQWLVEFERQGQRMLVMAQNTRFGADSQDPAELQAVLESFPRSVMASLPIVAEQQGSVLVDASDWFLQDQWDVRGALRRAGLSDMRVDGTRSALLASSTRAFEGNTEVRAMLTFTGDNPSPLFNRYAPDGRYLTLEQHHSLVRLPESPMPVREFDPRTGNNPVTMEDFSAPLDGEYRRRLVARWRLEPSDEAAYLRGELVAPLEPIVFYLDPALQEPYLSAYRAGVLWWNQAFEAAGFRDAIEVAELPADADPMDARYSILQVVHRSGAGPSVGPGFRDPRSGELLRAVPRMDSHRSLIDYNIYAGLLPAYESTGVTPQLSAEEFAMQRRISHVAHEVGHTLGLPHNFIAATQQRSSVMDYPFPLIEFNDAGELDISRAYELGLGYNDALSIRYAYTWYPDAEAEALGLAAIREEMLGSGHLFFSGADAALSGSYPEVHQWVEGDDMISATERSMAVRRLLLQHFDERAIADGEPLAWLNQRFAHVYYHHRYAVQGLVKTVGGMRYRFALRGDGQAPVTVIPMEEQREALALLLRVLSPEELAVPAHIPEMIPPLPFGYDAREPWLTTTAGPAFDSLALARSFAHEVIDALLHPERLARVAAFHLRDDGQLSLVALLDALVEASWGETPMGDHQQDHYLRVLQRSVLDGVFGIVADTRHGAEVRDAAHAALIQLHAALSASTPDQALWREHHQRARAELGLYLAQGQMPELRAGVAAPLNLPWP